MARKAITDLTSATFLANNDIFAVVTGVGSSPETKSITANLVYAYISTHIPGPYANDSVANTNGIALKSFYYDSSGFVKVRIV